MDGEVICELGRKLEVIETEVSREQGQLFCSLFFHLANAEAQALGFLPLADNNARIIFTTAWDPLPAPSASLLSIAPGEGLAAAAGPDGVSIATTDSIRKAIESLTESHSRVLLFQPQLIIPLSARPSQLTFTADEKYLVLSAETGGVVAAYDVQKLLQGETEAVFELATNGEVALALVPNPTSERAELCAIVTDKGNLYIANLKKEAISRPLRSQVSCISWSSAGEQLIAGLENGSINQMNLEGNSITDIPTPPGLESYRGRFHLQTLLLCY
jgi:nucleoporin NUP159